MRLNIKKLSLSLLAIVSMLGAPVIVTQTSSALAAVDAVAATKDVVQRGVNQAGGNQNSTDLSTFVRSIINILLFVIGLIAVLMIIIGGLRYVLSGGDSNSTNAAKNTILYAVIGLVVAIMAYAIVNFVVDRL